MARSVFGPGATSSGRSAVDERCTQPLQSVYEQVLGSQMELLHPQLRRYFGLIPAGHEGRGRGVYSWAGPRHSVLRPVFAWLAWRHVTKLDPERPLTPAALEAVYASGTDAIVLGGSTGMTQQAVLDLLSRLADAPVPVALEDLAIQMAP